MPTNNVYGTLTNADVVPISNGELIRVSANKRGVRALASSTSGVQGLAGVNISGIVGIGGPMNIASTAFNQKVLCETGLTLAAGETLYVSASVAGRATNVAPATPVAIGAVADVGSYAIDAYVSANIAIPGAVTGPYIGPSRAMPALNWYSDVINLVATGDYEVVPPVGYRFDRGLVAWQIVTKSGTISTSPTYSAGTNAGTYDDLLPAQTTAGFTTQAANTFLSPSSFVSPTPALDLSTNGLRVRISIAATGVTPVLTGRFRIVGSLVPL